MACAAGPDISESGLVLALDAANKKSYSQNEFQYSTDIFGWSGTSAYAATLSRDTISSPVGNTPLKMVVTGNDPHLGTYNSGPWNIAPAANGQTWVVSVYVKANVATTGEILIFGANSAGTGFVGGAWLAISAVGFNVTTEWARVSYYITMANADIAFIHTRLDGPHTGGTGQTVWWDGLQVERVPAGTTTPTPFTSSYYGGSVYRDLVGSNNGTLVNGPTYNSANGGSLVFDGVDDYITTANTTISGSQTFSVWAMVTGGASLHGILTQHNYASTANFGINKTGNKLAPSIGYTNGTREYDNKITNFTITNDVIFNAVLVYNSSENKIYWYINGQLDSSYTLSATPKSTNYPIGLGRWDAGFADYYFNGRIYSGNIHNRALTAQEIQQNFNATRSRFGI